MTIVRALTAGLVAGVLGTAAMDAVWYLRYRRQAGTARLLEWEFAEAVNDWESASAPGQVGRRAAEFVLGETPPDTWARPATNLVHWATGVGWGLSYTVAKKVFPHARLLAVALGPAAWLTSYAILPLLKVYRPIWKYDARTLRDDLSAHLVFGLTAASAFAVIAPSRRRR
ncbi:hypothetical protein [Orlajensenia leifsoniae]|uniref:DUF1440 domain-containing protein n=1 Tax=Orlajensenia leifsoniae TaxID=2561933 RepID=A0A4Y9RAR9_9MICO|nr:hypothetical protein [Leifsonia flava]TFW00186.1 hypothetical protein E4M00_03085 [Leifsonia flava]